MSQSYIETREIFKTQTDYKFSNEWQFISSDLYLFNANKFNTILNKTNPTKRKNKFLFFKKKNKDIIKNIMVTANLDGLGNLDKLTYPLFNFVVKKDDDGNYNIQVTDPEVIRIVDDVPISVINGYIGVKINVNIYSDKNKPEIYKFISEQLQVASSLTAVNTADAALKVVGEIGKMMENDAAGKQYEFSSTIRIYEEEQFDKQINSISVFVFTPSDIRTIKFNTRNIEKFMDTARVSKLTKSEIKKLINIYGYPYLVAVNYRTKYRPKITDDIDENSLNQRTIENETQYKNKLRSREVYLQEKSLIDFLQHYVQLKKDIGTYELNYNTKSTEDFTIQLFNILQDYWKLKNTFDIIDKSNKDDSLYKNQFKPIYQRYLVNASLQFEFNSELRAVREHVETIHFLENKEYTNPESATTEDFLRKLKTIKIPQREQNSEEANITKRWISNLENEQYASNFLPYINQYKKLPINQESLDIIQNFKLESTKSYCELCKINVNKFVEDYMKKYDEHNYIVAQQTQAQIITNSKQYVFNFSKKTECIGNTIDSLYPTDIETPDNITLVKNNLNIIKDKINNLNTLITSNENYITTDEIYAFIKKVNDLTAEIKSDLGIICKNEPELCDCEFFKVKEKSGKHE